MSDSTAQRHRRDAHANTQPIAATACWGVVHRLPLVDADGWARFASPTREPPPGRRRRDPRNAGGDSGWVAVADQVEARLLLATTSQFVRCTVVLRGGSSEVRRSLVTWSLVEQGGVDDLTAGFYRDSLLRDARHKLRARSAAGSDAIRAARPSLREYSAVDSELMELDLRDACEGRVLATPVEDTIRGSKACSEGTLVFGAGALALRVAGRRVVCGGLLASSGG